MSNHTEVNPEHIASCPHCYWRQPAEPNHRIDCETCGTRYLFTPPHKPPFGKPLQTQLLALASTLRQLFECGGIEHADSGASFKLCSKTATYYAANRAQWYVADNHGNAYCIEIKTQ